MRVSDTAMSKFKTRILAALGLVIFVLTISLLSRGHSTAQDPRDCPGVSICNTDAQPVPVHQTGVARVEGAVQINNAESQPIPVSPQGVTQVGGTVDVGSPVRVQTSTREPVHVVFVASAPENFFYAQGTVGLRQGDNSILFSPPGFEVPAGKTLRLQHVSADIEMGNPLQVPHVTLKVHPQHPGFPLAEVYKGFVHWSINHPLPSVPVSPGFQIEILFQRAGTAGQATLTLVLTGELQ